jgi:hypothetical protein
MLAARRKQNMDVSCLKERSKSCLCGGVRFTVPQSQFVWYHINDMVELTCKLRQIPQLTAKQMINSKSYRYEWTIEIGKKLNEGVHNHW